MITVNIEDKIIKHCIIQVDKYNFGKRFDYNGDKKKQLLGIVGQCVILDLFNLPLINGADGFDNGIDLTYKGKTIDVKTMGRTTYPKSTYTNNFLQVQDYLQPDIYLFCSIHKKHLKQTICGYISKQDFKHKRRYYPKGTIRKRTDGTTFETFADLYEIDNNQLNDITSIQQLKKSINL